MKDWRWAEWADFLGRSAIIAYFTLVASLKIIGAATHIRNWHELAEDNRLLILFSDLAVILFLLLVVITTLFRLRPIKSADGLEPRLSALAGTFLLIALSAFPQTEPRPSEQIFGLTLILIGFLLSAYVLSWLGRSFSIVPEARKLVTRGPYAVVRHPLYVTEEIAAVGIIVLSFSWQALIIGLVHWMLQLRRMQNEEKVLRSAFTDYDAYAARTPRVIPRFSSMWQKSPA
jgi:protein-S-isoprenylcysteine O-methyltransferase Ste14